ncbi:UPF0481 protein [Arachis hypogaea]|nr:UPF0481 protein [Arachis hypogaea]
MEETKWVVQINEELKGNGPSICDEKEQWKRPSIYKIPQSVTELNKKAYEPQAVSFGPYHKGKDHLNSMEEHKHRALIHYLKRCNKSIELVFQRMDQVVQELKDSYRPLDPIWDEDKNMFLQLMIVDGCFMLEILRANDCVPSDYAENDPVFSEHGKLYVMPYIKRDMLMLENQLPMLVLHTLIEIESDGEPQDDELLNKQILRFLSPTTTIRGKMGKCMHALDVYRKGLVMQGPTHPTRIVKSTTHRNCCYRWFTADSEYSTTDEIIRSATELHEAGIWFRKSSSHSLQDVSFDRGILRLPTMVVDDTTEPMFLNLMAFERLHVGAGNEERDPSECLRVSQGRGEALQLAVQGHHCGPPRGSGCGADELEQLLQEAMEQVARQSHPHLLPKPLGYDLTCCRHSPICTHHCSDSVCYS